MNWLGSHYQALPIGYLTAAAGWLIAARLFPRLWPSRRPEVFAHPWRELTCALLGCLGVLAMGQLYVHVGMLPARGSLAPLIEACNQLLIFAPILAVPPLRRHGLHTAWLPTDYVWARLLVGLVLAALAILAFTLTRRGSDDWLVVYPRVYQLSNFGMLIQVLCEDLAIAILFVRLRSVIGLGGAITAVACLFAAGHIPTMLAHGATSEQLARLLLDAALGILVVSVGQRSADVWWLWCVHFAMDMMQFHAGVSSAL